VNGCRHAYAISRMTEKKIICSPVRVGNEYCSSNDVNRVFATRTEMIRITQDARCRESRTLERESRKKNPAKNY